MGIFTDLSNMDTFILAIIFLGLLWRSLVLLTRKKSGPYSWPVVGMLPSVFLHVNDIYDWTTQMMIECGGTLKFNPPWMSKMFSLVTTDTKNIEYILKTKFTNFPKGSYFNSIFHDLLGDGILNVDGAEWKHLRKAMSSVLHSPRYKNFVFKTVNESISSRLIPLLDKACKTHSVVDLQKVLVRFAFDTMGMLSFGVDLGCLRNEQELEISRAMDDAMDATFNRFITPSTVWKAMKVLGIGSEAKLKASIEIINDFADKIIKSRRKELSSKEGCRSAKHDLLSIFMQNHDALTDKFLRDSALNVVLAGRETTSYALCWFFWFLTHHPKVEGNVLSEIRGIVLKRSNPLNSNFTVDELKEMHYLQAALSETLRLYPSLPINYKEVIEDEVLPDGTRLKKGTNLIFPIYSMARMESIWGEDCREFKPERWLSIQGVYVPEDGFKCPVFNEGPRVCLGKDFAYLQMKWVAASIVYRYRVKLAEDMAPRPKLHITLGLDKGLLVNLHPRSESH